HLPLEGAARVVDVGRDAEAAQLPEEREHALPVRAAVDDEEDVEPRLLARDPLVLEREQQALEPGSEADARRRRPADLLDERVVAPAAADRRVDVLVGADELER